MRIAYGVHGYGRGHASRALAVLPELTVRHEVLILAGGDAYAALRNDYAPVRIPTLRYSHYPGGRLSKHRTIKRNLPAVLGFALGGPDVEMIGEAIEEFAPDIVVSDSEPWTHQAAERLQIPRISFDRYGALAYCRWPMRRRDRLAAAAEALAYQWLMGRPQRVIVASFYDAPPRRPNVRVVGPVLRPAVRRQTPEQGDYLLVYFANGEMHFTPRVAEALQATGVPVRAYGIGRSGREGNIEFRPPGNEAFVQDLAGSRAVFSTAGNQLISECLYFRKPVLVMPEDSLEQRLNAAAVERMNIGQSTTRDKISREQLDSFLAAEQQYRNAMPEEVRDGRAEAVGAIEQFAKELIK
ncbi:MAG: glycosyltransferase family protein [Phycisphaerae bacterium]